MPDIRNVRSGSATPDRIFRIIDSQPKEIKRIYKVVNNQPVIVWDVGTEELKKMLVIFFHLVTATLQCRLLKSLVTQAQ